MTQARALDGHQIDNIANNRLMSVLDNRWLMKSQECHYRPPREAKHGGTALVGLDVALLMVDNRPPLPYELEHTPMRSPSAWGCGNRIQSRACCSAARVCCLLTGLYLAHGRLSAR